MTVVSYARIPVSALCSGDVVSYGGESFTVAEVLPLAVLGGDVVVGVTSEGKRVALLYANTADSAELVSLRGAHAAR